MKTVGERIRQARDAVGISGEALAKKVGYKNQSAIGNLENRAVGTGGNKISAIADALNVPVGWLLSGPDSDNVPFLPPKIPQGDSTYRHTTVANEHAPNTAYHGDEPLLTEAIELLQRTSKRGLQEVVPYLRFQAQQHPATPHKEHGERDHVPHGKAA